MGSRHKPAAHHTPLLKIPLAFRNVPCIVYTLWVNSNRPTRKEVLAAAKIVSSAGGYSRMDSMTPEQRSEFARMGAYAKAKKYHTGEVKSKGAA